MSHNPIKHLGTTFQQNVTNNAIGISSTYGAGGLSQPGLIWYTTDNNATKPKAGIWTQATSSGSWLSIGTSNAFATGITNNAINIDPTGNVITGVSLAGSYSSGGNLTLTSTTHATKGKILFGTSAYDHVNNRLGVGQASPTQAVEIGGTSAQLYLNSATSNMLYYNTAGTGTPTFTTRSVGTKIVVYPAISDTQVDFGLGIESGALWFSTVNATSSYMFKWYGGTTELMRLRGDGHLGINDNNPAQALSVTGNIAATGFISSKVTSVSVVNGLNSNIAVTSSYVRLTGPTLAFSVGGFTNPADGNEITIYNTTSNAMTIVNEDASSTAANRIKTLTGSDVVLAARTSVTTFVYDATDTRWVLASTFSGGPNDFLPAASVKSVVYSDSPYTVPLTYNTILADSSSGAISIIMPTSGNRTDIKWRAGVIGNAVVVTVASSGTIEGQNSYTFVSIGDSITLVNASSGAWVII